MDETKTADYLNSNSSEVGKRKNKIRIKYRQRVKIKKRPRGYKIKRYWKKNSKKLFSFLILTILICGTIYLVIQVAKQKIEKNQHELRQKL